MFSKKATKIDEIFTVYLTLYSKCQIDGEDFVDFCGLLRKHELYIAYSHLRLEFHTLQGMLSLVVLTVNLTTFYIYVHCMYIHISQVLLLRKIVFRYTLNFSPSIPCSPSMTNSRRSAGNIIDRPNGTLTNAK